MMNSNDGTPQDFPPVTLQAEATTWHWSNIFNPGYGRDSNMLRLDPWPGNQGSYSNTSPNDEGVYQFTPPIYEAESTMDWHYCLPIHFLHLRYACAVFRYFLVTLVPYYSILHDCYEPIRRRRIIAIKCWEEACFRFAGRHGMMLEAYWTDPMGQLHNIDPNILFETVRLHTILPEKSSSSRV